MQLAFCSNKKSLGIFFLLFLLSGQIKQAQAVTFKLNNDYYYDNFNFTEEFSQQDLFDSTKHNFAFLEQPTLISLINVETNQPNLIKNVLTSLKELEFKKLDNNFFQETVPILERSGFDNIYKNVYDFDVDLVPHAKKIVINKNTDSNLNKQENPHYLANWNNNQIRQNSLPILTADNSWTKAASTLPTLFANNNYSQLQFNRSTQNSPINLSKMVTISEQAVFAQTTPQRYQSTYLVNKNKPEALKKLEISLEQQEKEMAKQQNRILKQIQQNQIRLKKEAERKQEELRKKREQELKRIKQIQDKRQKNLQREIANQQKSYFK